MPAVTDELGFSSFPFDSGICFPLLTNLDPPRMSLVGTFSDLEAPGNQPSEKGPETWFWKNSLEMLSQALPSPDFQSFYVPRYA